MPISFLLFMFHFSSAVLALKLEQSETTSLTLPKMNELFLQLTHSLTAAPFVLYIQNRNTETTVKRVRQWYGVNLLE